MKAKTSITKGNGKAALNARTLPKATSENKSFKSRVIDTTGRALKTSPDKEDLRSVLSMVKAIRSGDFAMRINISSDTMISDIAEVLNDINEMNLTIGIVLGILLQSLTILVIYLNGGYSNTPYILNINFAQFE